MIKADRATGGRPRSRTEAPRRVPSVFISYSRRDGEFASRLHDALAERGYDVWIDRDDIPPSAKWFDEIRAGVAGADGVVFVISPDSVASEVCVRELELATDLGKRIVPAVCREPDGIPVPEAAASLNWVFLRGAELTAAENWLVSAGEKQPPPTSVHREYVLTSRTAATRRQRGIVAAVSVALLIAIVLGVIALVQRSTAIHERNVATARFLDAAAQSNLDFDPELSVLLAVRAAQIAPGSASTEDLRQALASSHVFATFTFPNATETPDLVWSPDGTHLLVVSPGVSARILAPGVPSTRPIPLTPPPSRQQVAWDARGDRVIVGGPHTVVYNAATGQPIARLPGIAVRVALSRDGSRAVTTDESGTGHVVAVPSGRPLASFPPTYRGGVTCLALAPDDSVVAQCEAESTVTSTAPAAVDLWDPRTGRLLRSLHRRHFVTRLTFSPDSRRFVFVTTNSPIGQSLSALGRAAGEAGTFVYDTRSGRLLHAFPGSATAAAFSADGNELAYATIAGDLGHVYNFTSRLDQPLSGAKSVVDSIRFDSRGADVVTGSDDGLARVYDASTGDLLDTLAAGDSGPVRDASFGLADTAIATTSQNGEGRLWNSPNPRPVRQVILPPLQAPVASASFNHGGDRILETGSGFGGRTAGGSILSAPNLGSLGTFTAPSGFGFAGAAFSRDANVAAALAFHYVNGMATAGTLLTLDAANAHVLARITPTAVPTIAALDNAGDLAATGDATGAADEWDPHTGRLVRVLPGHGVVAALGYSPNGSLLAVAHRPPLPARLTFTNESHIGNVTIDLWNPRTGRLLHTLTGPQLTPLIPAIKEFAQITLAFSANGKLVTLAGADTNVWGFSTRTGAPARPLPIPGGEFATSLAISPDDRTLAAGTASAAYVWNLSTSAPLPAFQHADPSQFSIETGGGVYVGFTQNSQTLLTYGDDALAAWAINSHLQLFHAFAFRRRAGDLPQSALRVRSAQQGGTLGSAADGEDLIEALPQAVHEDGGVGHGAGIDRDTDAARVAVRHQRDVQGGADRRAEAVEAGDPRAGEIQRLPNAGHIAREEVDVFEHAADVGARQQVERAGDRVRVRQRPIGLHRFAAPVRLGHPLARVGEPNGNLKTHQGDPVAAERIAVLTDADRHRQP
jgi:WD40 repeat protein